MADPTQLQQASRIADKVRSGEWFSDAPDGVNQTIDDLFPNPEAPPQVAAPAPEPAPVQDAAQQYFLKTSTGTVYNTADDAARGVEEKDRVIAELRSRIKESEGRDPLKRNPPAPSSIDPAEAFFDEMAKAASSGDKKGYIQAFSKVTESVLAPYAPLLNEVAKERAIRLAEQRTAGVRDFYGSDAFRQITERVPVLKTAIEQLESDPRAGQAQLDQILELAKLASDGLRVPELARAQAQHAPAPAQSIPRPTLQSSTPTPTPLNRTAYRSDDERLYSREGRQEIIDRFKRGNDPTLRDMGI